MVDAIIICGGSGTRLGKIGEEIPKALIKITKTKTILDLQIEYLRKYKFVDNIYLAAGYKWWMIADHIQDKKYKATIVVQEKKPLGTAGAINNILKRSSVSDEFIAFNVDDLVDLNLKRFITKFPRIAVCNPKSSFGIVQLNRRGIITEFLEKSYLKDVWVSCGWYYLTKKINLPDKGMLETDVFPRLRTLRAYKHEGLWLPVNNTRELEEAKKVLK